VSAAHRVPLEDLYSLIERMAAFERTFEEAGDQADNQARQLHATWTGAAAAEHQAVHARWAAGRQEMHAALATMRAIAQTAHDNYTAAGSTNSQMWAL
jgi:WXG100 family type VII secretion target